MPIREMFATRAPVRDIPEIAAPGLYAIFARAGVPLGAIHLPDDGIVYIGQSGNLAQRNHFRAVHSGFHSPRRSMGAILKESLNLKPIPRSLGRSKTNYDRFRFTDEGEAALSAWMAENLEYAIFPATGDLLAMEGQAIRSAEPPLNLNKWKNPQKTLIESLRKVCKDEAKAVWARMGR